MEVAGHRPATPPRPGGRSTFGSPTTPRRSLGASRWSTLGTVPTQTRWSRRKRFRPANRLDDPRPGIWISYVPVDEAHRDVGALTHVRSHRLVALSEYEYERVKIGAGPPPLRVDEGWLLIHHGVSGSLSEGWAPQREVHYSAGAMLLDPADPGVVLGRTPQPLLAPTVSEERDGAVPNVVFPTAIEEVGGQRFVFYGMADSSIGVARLDHVQ